MFHVVCNDGVRAAGNREFEQEFVARVGQGWPQPEVDRRFAAEETEGADDCLDRLRGNIQPVSRSASLEPTASYSRIRGTFAALPDSPVLISFDSSSSAILLAAGCQ